MIRQALARHNGCYQSLVVASHSFRSPKARTFSRFLQLRKSFEIEQSVSPRPRFSLREYQQECINKCLEALESARRRIGVSLPTGGGKTVVFSTLIDHVKPRNGHGDKVLILAHRKELVFQAATTCKSIHPDKIVEVEMADYHATEDADIIVASVQTLMRGRLEKLNPHDFKMVIVDEAHHAAAESYVSTFKHFGITTPDSDVALVGFSATLQRDDSKNLADVIDEVVFHMNTDEMVTNKHLCDAKFTTVKMIHADLSGVATRAGEFVIPKLSEAVNVPENSELVLRTYLHFVNTQNVKSTLLFGVDIRHVKALSALFRERGVHADYVTSETKAAVRKDRIAKFKSGEIAVLMNCGIFTEGTDIPNIDCVLLVRPTRSKNLLIQMIGRGLRLHHSKEFCHIVDFVGVNNASVVSVPCLKGLPSDDEINDLTLEEMEERKVTLEEKKRKREEKERLEQLERERKSEKDLEMDLAKGSRQDAPKAEFDEDAFNFQNIELKTFESFHDFIEMGELSKDDDQYYIRSSLYPWVKVGSQWILYYPSIKPNVEIHLRLQRFKKGITRSFIKSVKVTNIYKSKKDVEEHMDTNQTFYTLSSYTTNPNYDTGYNRFAKKYKALLLLPLTTDIRAVLSYVDKIFKERFRGRDYTKYAKWRNTPASEKQQIFAYRLVNKYIRERFDQATRLAIINEIPSLRRGVLSDFLLAQSIFGSTAVETFASALHDRAQKEIAADPKRTLNNLKPLFKMIESSRKSSRASKQNEEDPDMLLVLDPFSRSDQIDNNPLKDFCEPP